MELTAQFSSEIGLFLLQEIFGNFMEMFSRKRSDEIVRQEQHQCPFCREIPADDYIEQNPFPEIQCPSCGSLMEISLDIEEEIALQNIRNAERNDISLKVTYKSFNRFILDYTNNVSEGNMFIKTKASYEIGARVDLLLHVAGLDVPIRIMGRVKHNGSSDIGEDDGIGIEFIDIDEQSREILIQKLKSARGAE
jgi:uncharacterized protein (TIGR02266 family)